MAICTSPGLRLIANVPVMGFDAGDKVCVPAFAGSITEWLRCRGARSGILFLSILP